MNILILSWRGIGHPHAGGAETVTHEHAKAWVKAGHKVTLFTSSYPGAKNRETINGVHIVRMSHELGGVHFAAWKWYRSLSKKPDLVVDQLHGIPFFTPLYVKGKKLAFIHEVAKEVWLMNPLMFPFNIIYGLAGYLSEPFIFKLFYRRIPFMTVSDSTTRDLEEWGVPKENITVIHNGINAIEVKEDKEKKKTAVFLGALAKDKGIEDAIKVFALINRSDPNWQFWIVGRGLPDYVQNLKTQAKKLEIGSKIKFFGFVSERRKFELLAGAHVLINPSAREGWGLVNIEANSVGTPVVGYKVPGVKDSVLDEKTGLLAAPGDTRRLAENCLKLVNNERIYEKFRKNAIEFSKKFSWKKSTRESLKLIESL